MILYPQLPHAAAEQLADERRSLSIREAAEVACWDHPDVFFTPTGGRRATKENLIKLRAALVDLAMQLGYPDSGNEQAFDKPAAALLHSSMQLSPAEASKAGVWAYLCCVLLCDLVRWRFPGDAGGSPLERLLASRRNTFQRLWWRGYVFCEPASPDPYHLLQELGEDEAVQIMERPFLAGSRALSRTVARELLAAANRHPRISRRILIREGQKRLRRVGAFTSFEAVDEAALAPFVQEVFDQVAEAAD